MSVLPEGDHGVVKMVCRDREAQRRARAVIEAWDEKHRFLFATFWASLARSEGEVFLYVSMSMTVGAYGELVDALEPIVAPEKVTIQEK
jgi:hypothetical protein